MVELASADDPDVLCLQELPVWALPRLGRWSGMTAFPVVAARPVLVSATLGRALTALHHGLFRSALTGQGNAMLLGGGVTPRDHHAQALHPGGGRLHRRVCQVVRAMLPDGRSAAIANLHASEDPKAADAELRRAADFALGLAEEADVCILAGDFNLEPQQSRTMGELWRAGFSVSRRSGIDHVLVRGAGSGPADRWPDDRRRLDGRLLSDHAPVEVTIE